MFSGRGSLGEGPRSGLVRVQCAYPIDLALTHNILKAGPQYPQRSSVVQETLSCLAVVGISPPRDRIMGNIPDASESWEADCAGCSETN